LSPSDAGTDAQTPEASADAIADTSIADTSIADVHVQDGGDGGGWCPAMTYPNPNMCKYPTQCGPVVPIVQTQGNAPTAQGGTVIPGLYFLTRENVYGDQDAGAMASEQLTMQLGASTFEVNDYVDGFQNPPSSGTWTTNGTMLVRAYNGCPDTLTIPHPYTASPTTLTLYETQGTPYTFELILTKQ